MRVWLMSFDIHSMPPKPDILRRMSGPFYLNTFFLTCSRTRETLIIDPGDHTDSVLAFILENEMHPTQILLTHGHADQFFSMDLFKQTWDIPYGLHQADIRFFKDSSVQTATRKAVGLPPPYSKAMELAHGDGIRFGDFVLSVIHTPGHTPGSVCFFCQDNLFAGDTLFVGEAGRTDLPGGNLEQMIGSIRDRIMTLPLATRIHPGHHHPASSVSTSLAREMKENIYITDFILDP